MKLYVAGSSRELDRAQAAIAYARSRGHEITFDWTVDMLKNIAAGRTDKDLTDAEAETYAAMDKNAVYDADALLFLSPTTQTKGAWVELGLALGFGKRIVVSYKTLDGRTCIFESLAPMCWDGDEAAVRMLEDLTRFRPAR